MTDYERDLAAGGEPAQSDYERDLAAGGTPVEAPHEDKVAPYGLSGVITGSGGRPTGFLDRLKFAAQHPIDSLRDEIPKAYEGAQAAADNMLNAASLGAYRQVRDARNVPEALRNTGPASARTQETARFNEAHPVVAAGSELAGSLVGAPEMAMRAGGAALKPAIKAVDSAIGRKALELATRPATPPGPVAKFVKKAAERTIHGAIGHSVGGMPGLITSQVLSPLAHDATAAIGNRVAGVGRRAVGGLAERYLGQAAPALAEDSGLLMAPRSTPVPDAAELADIIAQTEPGHRPKLAPLISTAKSDLERLAPYFDEISGDLLTNGGKLPPLAPTHGTVGGATGVMTNPLDVGSPGRPSLADIARDAKEFRAAPPDVADPLPDALGDDLARSVRMLDDLRAGKITTQQALDAGISPALVKKVAHR